jgi:hypothetical protein
VLPLWLNGDVLKLAFLCLGFRPFGFHLDWFFLFLPEDLLDFWLHSSLLRRRVIVIPSLDLDLVFLVLDLFIKDLVLACLPPGSQGQQRLLIVLCGQVGSFRY